MIANKALAQEMTRMLQQLDEDEPIPVRAGDLARLCGFVPEVSEFTDKYARFLPTEARAHNSVSARACPVPLYN